MSATGERGATLIEVLVALAIMALAAAVSFPPVERAYGALGFRRAVEALAADLRAARAAALRQEQPVRFALAADGSAYALSAGGGRSAPAGLRFTGSAAILFLPDGTSSGGFVGVAGPPGQRLIAVDPVTGGLRSGAP